MRVRGFESSINIIPKQFAGVQWSSRVNFALNRAKIMELPVPPFLFSTAQVGAVRIEKGKSPTQLIGNDTVSVANKTPDGRDSLGLKVGQVVPVVMGDGNPDYTLGFGNDFKWKALSAYVLIDRQQGGMLAAGTWRHYDLGGNSRDYDVITPSGEQTLVGLVEARSGTTYIGASLQDVLGQWRGTTGFPETGSGPDSGATLKEKIAQIRKLLDEIEAEAGAGAP